MADVDLSSYVQGYVESRRQKQKPTTANQKENTLRHFTTYLDETGRVMDTDSPYDALDIVRDFFDEGPVKVSKPRLSHLRDFLQYVSQHLNSTRDQDKLRDIKDKIKKDRWPEEAFRSDEKAPEFLSDDDIREAWEAADDRGELVIRFLFETGFRLGEMRPLTPEDIHFDVEDVGAAIRINKRKDKHGNVETPKTPAGRRMVEISPETAGLLEDYLDQHDIGHGEEVFWMSDRTFQDDVKDAFTEIGVKINDGPDADQYKVAEGRSFVSCHWLRHNRNTRIKKAHGSEKAQQYMVHENQQMTDHYTEFDPDEVQGLVG